MPPDTQHRDRHAWKKGEEKTSHAATLQVFPNMYGGLTYTLMRPETGWPPPPPFRSSSRFRLQPGLAGWGSTVGHGWVDGLSHAMAQHLRDGKCTEYLGRLWILLVGVRNSPLGLMSRIKLACDMSKNAMLCWRGTGSETKNIGISV